MKIFLLASSLIIFVNCGPKGTKGYPKPPSPYPVKPPSYSYKYEVSDKYSKNNFGQSESRNGYNTKGEYFVNLPDGRLQKVKYTVNGDSGYVADVVYTGVAQYPPKPAGGYPGRK